jgi:glycine oxidase
MSERRDVVIIGAGVIGVAIAWRCAQAGLTVTVLDPAPGRGATDTAAGMLAPVTELHYEGRELLSLNVESARRYPAFVAELTDVTGLAIGYEQSGTIQAAWDAADLAALRDLQAFQHSLGLVSHMLTGRELRSAEPALTPGLPGGLRADDDHQVDPRRLFPALRAAAEKAGVTVVPTRAAGLVGGDPITGVVAADGQQYSAGTTVLAAGAWSRKIVGLPPGAIPPVRPVKGQTVRLRGEPGLLRRTLRATVKGNPVYIVPRADGEIVLGASSEEAGFDLRPRAGAVYELLRDAQAVVPALNEAEFVEVSTGLRPGSPDNAPIIGPAAPGLVVATGHFRNGILLAPVTADLVREVIVDGQRPPLLAAFGPERFASRETTR